MKKVIVTGATGFVGGYVVDALLDAGHQVSALVRNPGSASRLESKGVKLHQGDVLAPETIDAALHDMQVIVHLVGIIREKPGAGFEDMHARAAENVAIAAKRHGIDRIVHMSALGSRSNAVSRYHKTKWRGEEAVRASGIPYVIFRPSVIFGPGDEFMTLLRGFFKNPFFVPVIGPGTSLLQPVYAGDVARCFVAAVDNPDTVNMEFELVGPSRYSMPQLLDIIGDRLGRKRAKIHMPLPVARIMAGLFEKTLPEPPLTRDQLIMIQEDNIGDADPARRAFGIEFKSLQEIIPTYL